jgi:hypothetical protein
MRYAAAGKSGDYQQIAEDTGVPMGSSSGKVPAILDYGKGMGLLTLNGDKPSSVKQPVLTTFGRMVLQEDPFLKHEITQWVCHFNLCSPYRGAEVWYISFFSGKQILGMHFNRDDLEIHIQNSLNITNSNLIGPLIGTYEDDASFAICGALRQNGNNVIRKPAPISEEIVYGYGAWLVNSAETHFPKQKQISILDLNEKAGCRDIPGWNVENFQNMLLLLESKGILNVDRHMEPWLLNFKISSDQAFRLMYDDLI